MLRCLARLTGRADGEAGSPAARLCRVTLFVGVTAFVLHAFARWWGASIWDDAFIFQRYAINLAEGHGVAFNPEGAPTYGLTALLYLVPVAVVRLGVTDPALAALVTSCLSAAVALGLLGRLAFKAAGRGSSGWLAVASLAVVVAAPISAEHVVSGMDTWFGVAYLAVLLWGLHQMEARPSTWGRCGAMAAFALWVRPEMVLFGAATALAMLIWPKGAVTRRIAFKLGATIGATVLALMVGAWAYFEVPLPLPFFTKATGVYGPGFLRIYRGRGWSELGHFVAQVWPLLIPVGVELGFSPRRWWRDASATERGAATASVVLLLFHAVVALPIMGMHARFYQPVLPALVYLAARSLARLRARAEEEEARLWPAAVVGANVLLWTQLLPVAGDALEMAGGRAAHDPRVTTARLAQETGPRKYWPGLNALPEMPALTIATTEVGFIGVIAPEHRIIDLAGLNTKAFAFGPFDVDHLIDEVAPDIVYMPHPDYRDMTSSIENHERFRDTYIVLSRHRVGGSHFGVAIRKDGARAASLLAMVKPGKRPLQRTRAAAAGPPGE